MKKRISALVGGLIFSAVATTTALASVPVFKSTNFESVPNKYIVVLKKDPAAFTTQSAEEFVAMEAESMEVQYGATVVKTYDGAVTGMVVEATAEQLTGLQNDPDVLHIEEDQIVSLYNVASWGLDRIDQPSLPLDNRYTPNGNGAGVNAYIIDTGVRSTHVEFAGRMAPGFSSIQDGNGTEDCQGHGTHVAGTVAGSSYGVAPGATVYPVRVFACKGTTTMSNIIAGVDWVVKNAKLPAVANMSLGGGDSPALDAAVRAGITKGISFVVAAGNSFSDACQGSPNRIAEAITVGSVTKTDEKAYTSCWGACVQLFAPGQWITSAGIKSDTESKIKSGTSMAAPHVAGAVALYLEKNRTATPAQVMDHIVNTAVTGKLTLVGIGSPNRLLQVATGTPVIDTQAPTVPTGLQATANGTTVNLYWTASTDNIRVTGYDVYKNGTKVGTATGTNYSVSGLAENTTYTFSVKAKDAAGNVSAASQSVSVKTEGGVIVDPSGDWKVNTAYKVGDIVTYNGVQYKCITAHTAYAGWTPAAVPALWSRL